ncbi:hypothetical protein WN944_006428 [Citrus x changshan-huyou]|uniref:Uncharacterized protein n=1 Tax=Citrus x changshan-huyou TaxID=2935761 RepID=A0AAP0MJ52_9ROSI
MLDLSSDFLCIDCCCHRMLADPAFLYKLLLEQAATIGCTVLWELENHKESPVHKKSVIAVQILLYCLYVLDLHYSSTSQMDFLNVQLGERSRLAWLGVEADPLLQSYDLLKKAYNGAAQDVNGSTQKSPKWLISKNAIVSGLGLLGIKQGNVGSVEGEARAPKVRRKRIVRKKVTA